MREDKISRNEKESINDKQNYHRYNQREIPDS